MGDRHARHRLYSEWLGALIALFLIATASPVLAQSEPPVDITIDQMHLFILPIGDRLQVTEHYLLGNGGTDPYTGDAQGITVLFPLPEAASDVRLEGEDQGARRYVVQDDAIGDTAAIPPGSGTVEVRFAYEIPFEVGSDVERAVPLPVKSAVFLIGGARWALEDTQLAPLGSMEIGEQPAQAYAMVSSLEAGEAFSFTVVESNAESLDGRESAQMAGAPTRDLGLGLIALAAAAVAGLLIRRPSPVPEVPATLRDDIAAIAALDRRFAAGEISEETYRKARDALKAGIKTRLRNLRGSVDDR